MVFKCTANVSQKFEISSRQILFDPLIYTFIQLRTKVILPISSLTCVQRIAYWDIIINNIIL